MWSIIFIIVLVVALLAGLAVYVVIQIHKPYWGSFQRLRKCNECGEIERYKDQRNWIHVCPNCGSSDTGYTVARWKCQSSGSPYEIIHGPQCIEAEERIKE